MKLNVNGTVRTVDAEPQMPLLWALREVLGLTGTKYGCGVAQCGACTVHINGQPTRSCSIPVSAVGEMKVITIEGLGRVGCAAVRLLPVGSGDGGCRIAVAQTQAHRR